MESIRDAVEGFLGSLTLCHPWTTFSAGIHAAHAIIADWETLCGNRAEKAHNRQLATQVRSKISVFIALEERVWRISAGILAAFVARYASHLALDPFTPRALPILGWAPRNGSQRANGGFGHF